MNKVFPTHKILYRCGENTYVDRPELPEPNVSHQDQDRMNGC